jgi:hypothetical protein
MMRSILPMATLGRRLRPAQGLDPPLRRTSGLELPSRLQSTAALLFNPTPRLDIHRSYFETVDCPTLSGESMTSLDGVTHSHPEILSGTPVFVGTRVPVRSLFDYLEGGETLEEFLQ